MIITDTGVSRLSYRRDDSRIALAAPGTIRSYPRSPHQAVLHGLEYMQDYTPPAPYPWSGRSMVAVARCFGLKSAETGTIPLDIPGSRYSAIRQYRWLMQTYPDYAVPAPSPFTFGEDVPVGAVMYWDESSPYGSTVGISAGYRRGILQVLTTTADPSTKNWGLRDAYPHGCAGWTTPIFYAQSSGELWSLWDGDTRTVPSEYDFYSLVMDPTAATYDSDRYTYDQQRIESKDIWDLGERRFPQPGRGTIPTDPGPELTGGE